MNEGRNHQGRETAECQKVSFSPLIIVHLGTSGGVEENKRFSSVLRFPVCKGMRA